MNRVLVYALGLILSASIAYWYVSTTQAEIKALSASVELYKQSSEANAKVANDNAESYKESNLRYKREQEIALSLQKKIKSIESQQSVEEKSVVKYVETLPEGFERSCLNMPVNVSIGRVQQ